MPCPNKNLPIWNDLVNALGSEADALAAYTLNDYEIPTVDIAKSLLSTLKSKISTIVAPNQKSKALKLARVNEQIDTLERILKSSPLDARQETIKKLIENLKQYKDLLDNDEATVSVSNLIAGGEIEDMDKYVNYAKFGTFIHHVIEELQKETIGTNLSLTSVFNNKRLAEIFKNYSDTFEVSGLVENGKVVKPEELFNMSNEIVAVLQNYVSRGYTILPEITILGKDRFERNIVGRTDILAINNKGKVSVLDIKTKKVRSSTQGDSLAHSWPINASEYTDAEFIGGSRNAYENWDLQLGVYARMLQQIGIEPDEKMIIGLLYYGTYMSETGKQFDEDGNDTFSYDFYRTRSFVSSEFDKVSEDQVLRYKNMMAKIRKVLPLLEEDVVKPETNKDQFIFNLSKDEADLLIAKIDSITETELRIATQKLSEAKKKDAGQEIIEYYTERIQTLNKINEALKKDVWESPYKIGFVIKTLQVDLENLVKTVSAINQSVGEEGLTQRAKDLERLNRVAVGYNNFTDELKQLLLSAQVSPNSNVIQAINSIENNIKYVSGIYNSLGFRFTMEVLKSSLTENQVEQLNDQRKQALEDLIKSLKKKKDNLAAGNKESSFWYRISNPVSNIINSATGAELNPQTEIERLELQIVKLELEMEGVKLDDAGLKKYIGAILDPKAPLYIGEGTSFWTQYIAGSSSSDWVLSSYANQLKLALAGGTQEFVNFVERENLQTEFNKYKGGQTDINAINEPVSEIRNELEFDENGNETIVQRRAFVNPLSEEYYNVFDRHRNSVMQINKKIKEATDENVIKDLRQQKRDVVKQHLDWRLANTQMKLIDEIYQLDKLLPEDYKEERNALYEEKSLLENSAGFNNAEDLDDSTLYRIAEIEVELNKLRKKYADMNNGGYAKYLDLIDKYYEYETNQNYFDRLYNQKIIELTDSNGNVDIEALAKWKEQNMIKRPKQEWYDLIGNIWDEIFSIIGKQNPRIDTLKEKYKEILSQYKRRGAVDSRFMSQEDIDALNEIEEIIQLYKMASSKNGPKMDMEDRIAVAELFKDLETFQTRVENPFYVKEFDLRIDDLELAWNNYQTETETAAKDRYFEQFLLKEMEFKTWYDNNHTNTYVSKLVSNEGLNPLPKKFNTLTVPTSEEMMEEKPDYKFSIKKLKEIAYNPNYQEDAMGYPMPKDLSRDNATITGDSQWLNPKYNSIRNTPKNATFYHSFVGRFLDTQSKTTGRMLGYNFPGYEIQSLDDYNTKGIKDGVKNRMKMFREKNLVIGGEYDFSINGFNTNVEDRIQFKHNMPLPLDQQTPDGIGAVIRWYEQAHINKAMSETQAMSKSMIAYMEDMYKKLSTDQFPGKEQRMTDLRRTIDSMKFEYDKFVKGEWKKDQGMAGRFADLVLRGIGITRLGFDLPNQVGNLLSGNVQAFLGTHKSGKYSLKNYWWAKSKIEGRDGLIGSLMADYGKFGNRTFMTKMLLYWNPQQQSLDHYYNKTRTTDQRLKQGFLDANAAFWIQDKGELEISSTIWLAILDNNKVKVVKTRDADGKIVEYEKNDDGTIKTINAFEAYVQNANGEIVIRSDVDWSKADEQATMKTVWSEIRRTQGRYAEWDKSKIESGIIGRLLLYYRKYLEPSIRNRFGRRETNYEAAEMAQGFYNGFFTAFKIYGPGKVFMSLLGKESGMSDYYQRKSFLAARELVVSSALFLLGRMIAGAIPDDDDDDNKLGRVMLLSMIAVYAKVDMETRSLNPLPIIGGIDNYLENLGSFTNASRDIGRVSKMLYHGLYLGMSTISDNEYINKEAFYQRRSGMFEKGEAKIKKDIMDVSGYMNMYELFNPEVRVRNYVNRR